VLNTQSHLKLNPKH